jgi:hypothetical protein
MGTQFYEKMVEANIKRFRRCLGACNKRRRIFVPRSTDKALRDGVSDGCSTIPANCSIRSKESISSGDIHQESILPSIARQSIESIKDFAISTARQVPRIQNSVSTDPHRHEDPYSAGGDGGNAFQFGNFSLLASRPRTPSQFRHVDAHSYELQYVMSLQPGTEATAIYIVPDRLESPQDVVGLWKELIADGSTTTWDSASQRSRRRTPINSASQEVFHKVRKEMEDDETIVFWIRHYGRALCRPHRMIESVAEYSSSSEGWSTGSLVSLPGGVVHGAPRCTKFRVVLFFTATPSGRSRYLANDQFTGPTLTASVAYRLWDRVGDPERQFLAQVLRRSIHEDSCCSVDFTSYLDKEIGSGHEIGEIMRDAQESKPGRGSSIRSRSPRKRSP